MALLKLYPVLGRFFRLAARAFDKLLDLLFLFAVAVCLVIAATVELIPFESLVVVPLAGQAVFLGGLVLNARRHEWGRALIRLIMLTVIGAGFVWLFRGAFLVEQVAIGVAVGLCALILPLDLRSHRLRTGYLVSMILLGLGGVLVLLNQPLLPPMGIGPFHVANSIFGVYGDESLTVSNGQFELPPTFNLRWSGERWLGDFSATFIHRRSRRVERADSGDPQAFPSVVAIRLPADSTVTRVAVNDRTIQLYSVTPGVLEGSSSHAPRVVIGPGLSDTSLSVELSVDQRRHTLDVSFLPHLASYQARLGEQVLRFKAFETLGPGVWSSHLRLETNPQSMEVAETRPATYSQRTTVMWPLRRRPPGRDVLEVTLADPRLRFLAEQGPELLLLGGGIFLGLALEPASGRLSRSAPTKRDRGMTQPDIVEDAVSLQATRSARAHNGRSRRWAVFISSLILWRLFRRFLG